jgi:hypothetical protein
MQVMGLAMYIGMDSKVLNVTNAIGFEVHLCFFIIYGYKHVYTSTLTKLYLLPLPSEYSFC